MALKFMDGFDCYNAAADYRTGNRWASTSTLALGGTSGKRGGGALVSAGSAGLQAAATIGSALTEIVVGFWLFFATAPGSTQSVLRIGKGAIGTAQTQCALRMNSSRQLLLTNDDAGTILATGTTALALSTWYFIELKVKPADAGTYELRIDGVTEFSGSGDTQAEATAGADWIQFDDIVNGSDVTRYDDVYVLDTTGSAPHNDFLGPIYIDQIVPEADNSVQGTPSAGSNFQCVDEARNNGDTDYVSFGASGIDLYDMTTLSDSPSNIYGVQIVGNFRRDDASAVTARNKMKNGATTSTGADRTTNTSYEWWADLYETNPDTAAAWTLSDINGLIAGVERV